MEYRLLGPVEVEREGRVLRLGGPKQRAVLAILLLREGESVPSDVLIDGLWGESAPVTARNALQGYVFQLRKVLEPTVERGGSHRILVSDGAGYRLQIEPRELDIRRFESLTVEARKLLASSPAAAATRFEEALALWRGPPLADLAFEPFAQADVHRLEELRLAAEEDRLDALLASGRHADLVGELEALVERHPLRERLRGQLLLALYRAGRQSDALEAYARARDDLIEQLGVEPGPDLRELQVAILNQDPSLAAPPRREPVGFRPPPRPPTRLVGREQAIEEVTMLLREHHVVTLLGPGGVGKTRLGLAVAERAAGDYSDGVGWVELENVRDSALVLPEIAAAAGLEDVLADLDGRHVLLVLDNLEQVLGCSASLAELVGSRAGRSPPRDEQGAARHRRRTPLPGAVARAGGRDGAVLRSRRRPRRLARRQRGCRRRHLSSSRRPSARARACRGASEAAVSGRVARPAAAESGATCRRRARSARAPTDDAFDDRLERRAAVCCRASLLPPHVRLQWRLHARGGRGGLQPRR